MKLAILNWRDLAHPDAGGAEVFVHEVGRRWVAQGHDVRLFSSRAPGLEVLDVDQGLEINRIGRLKNGSHHVMSPRAIRSFGPDAVLESINTIPYLLPMRRSFPAFLPLVHQMAVDIWQAHFPGPVAGLARRAERVLLKPYRNTLVAAVSESTKADLESVGVRSVTVIPQGGIGPQPLEDKETEPTFLFVGRLAANKRPDHAVEAFRIIKQSLPSARLWVVGEGPMRDELEASLPEGAELLGRISRTELFKRMSRAHVLLVTSIREGWGLVVTEANAMGTPAVAYDVPGLRDSIRHGETGLLTPPDPKKLGNEAASLISHRDLFVAVRTQSIKWGSNCTWDETAYALIRMLDDSTSIQRVRVPK